MPITIIYTITMLLLIIGLAFSFFVFEGAWVTIGILTCGGLAVIISRFYKGWMDLKEDDDDEEPPLGI